ncbi:hypothetical protein E4U15_005662 [Claviceps sp. LM218 group G6]|nr:hypothetical protein E4U15_005662 [Claviceps sp. LM218 group G6]
MSTLHKIAMRDIRGKNSTKGQPLTTRTKKTQFQSESLSCICAISSRVTQPTLGPESSRSIYNRHTEVAKRANTNFENWTAQWSVFEHEPIAGNVGEVQGIARIHNVFDAIGALVGPVWASLTIRERAPKDRLHAAVRCWLAKVADSVLHDDEIQATRTDKILIA